jgi:hypothetical protein
MYTYLLIAETQEPVVAIAADSTTAGQMFTQWWDEFNSYGVKGKHNTILTSGPDTFSFTTRWEFEGEQLTERNTFKLLSKDELTDLLSVQYCDEVA